MSKSELTTLIYLDKEDQYLMLHRIKKEHDINKDKWVGVGGHFEPHESPDECLIREVREETGLELTSYRARGIVTFDSARGDFEYMFLYTADGWRNPNADPNDPEALPVCNEGVLEWVDKEKVLDLNIWEGDKIFFRLLNEGVPFFSLKMRYDLEDRLVEAVLDGVPLETSES